MISKTWLKKVESINDFGMNCRFLWSCVPGVMDDDFYEKIRSDWDNLAMLQFSSFIEEVRGNLYVLTSKEQREEYMREVLTSFSPVEHEDSIFTFEGYEEYANGKDWEDKSYRNNPEISRIFACVTDRTIDKYIEWYRKDSERFCETKGRELPKLWSLPKGIPEIQVGYDWHDSDNSESEEEEEGMRIFFSELHDSFISELDDRVAKELEKARSIIAEDGKYYPLFREALSYETPEDYLSAFESYTVWWHNILNELRAIFIRLELPYQKHFQDLGIDTGAIEEPDTDPKQPDKAGDTPIKQQILLLEALGVFDTLTAENIATGKQREIIAKLLNRSENSLRKPLEYRRGNAKEATTTNERVRTPQNIKAVNEMLSDAGFGTHKHLTE